MFCSASGDGKHFFVEKKIGQLFSLIRLSREGEEHGEKKLDGELLKINYTRSPLANMTRVATVVAASRKAATRKSSLVKKMTNHVVSRAPVFLSGRHVACLFYTLQTLVNVALNTIRDSLSSAEPFSGNFM